ncbi:hypothetical protein [Candidatus Nitrosotenuis chungbukensis]|uniref:hypothetical protein n=1 Tax=Candidatus Nitrosotenuis chungbukensis TaxID=1353246 RepID=UPI0005B2DB35|nr:hypothetical protein [Candidatus Nitrosotenuis chungbukensis]
MTKTTLSALFTVAILLSAAFVASSGMVEQAYAVKSQSTTPQKLFGPKTTSKVCGEQLCYDADSSVKTDRTNTMMELKTKSMPVKEYNTKSMPLKESKTKMMGYDKMMGSNKMMGYAKMHQSAVVTKTMQSAQDPAAGHESHQLAVILPPSGKIYKGTLTYAASEPVQLVALHGPLAEGEATGQPIWSPDGKTKFALTFVDTQQASGTWNFAGNALAVHTKNPEPFTVSYTVSYMEKQKSDTVKSGTMQSAQDPAAGHESHQLAVILPPSDKPYAGMITYAASEPVQLVALHGPLAEGEATGQPIWSPDGKTKFALTFVDTQQASGTWNFAGNALAVHTKNPEPFTVSYTVVAGQ